MIGPKPRCSVDDCKAALFSKGLCSKHYQHERRARIGSQEAALLAAAKLALRFISSLNGRVPEEVWRDSYEAWSACNTAIDKSEGR